MTWNLYVGCFRQASNLASTMIRDINPWLPHRVRFRWGYMATHTTLWLDVRDQFTEEHITEWEAQKSQTCPLNDLEWDTEVIYQACIIKRQDNKAIADSREAAAKQLPPERQTAHAERQVSTMPMNPDAASMRLGAALYPNWVLKQGTKPKGSNVPRPYRMFWEGTGRDLTIEEELDADSMFDPLQPASQSNQPLDSQCSLTPDTTMGAEGPKMPPHYSDVSAIIPPFDLVRAGILPPMSPITDGEKCTPESGARIPCYTHSPTRAWLRPEEVGGSSCSGSPMSLGSPAVTSSLVAALKVCAQPAMPAMFGNKEELSEGSNKEEMDATDEDAKEGMD